MVDWILQTIVGWMEVSPASAGESVTPRLRFDQPLPQWLLVAVGLLAIVIVVGTYSRERRVRPTTRFGLATIRLGLILVALFMISEATLVLDRSGRPSFLVVLDNSASMQVRDRYPDRDQAEALLNWLAEDPASSSTGDEVGQSPSARSTEPDGERSKESDEGELQRQDPSDSNRFPDRFTLGKSVLAREQGQLLRAIAKDHFLRLSTVSDRAKVLAVTAPGEPLEAALEAMNDIEPTADQSRLGEGLIQILDETRGIPPAGLILISDGQRTGGPSLMEAAELASRRGVPILVVGVGDPQPPRDLELSDLEVDEVVFVNDRVLFRAKLEAQGMQDRSVQVQLSRRQEGANPDSEPEVIETQSVDAPGDSQVETIEIVHQPQETGRYTYSLEITPESDELLPENNSLVRTIDVRDEKIGVLLVDSYPRYEYRYLKNYLERDESVELGVVLQSADPEYARQDRVALPTLPTTAEALAKYDVVILGDMDPNFVTPRQLELLRDLVIAQGGGCLFISGTAFNPLAYSGTPLEDLLPIRVDSARNPTAFGDSLNAFRAVPTAAGLVNPILRLRADEAASRALWGQLPNLRWLIQAPDLSPSAQVLVEHPDLRGSNGPLPIIAFQYVGRGRSLWVGTDELYRWRIRIGDRFFGRLYIQAIRFLARSKLLESRDVELSVDRLEYAYDQRIEVRTRFTSPDLTPDSDRIIAELQGPSGTRERVELARQSGDRQIFTGSIPPQRAGRYQISLIPLGILEEEALPEVGFTTLPPAGEFERISLNESELRRAATLSGGAYFTPTRSGEISDALPSARRVPLNVDPPLPLWSTWPVLATFLALLVSEWLLRKRVQLI